MRGAVLALAILAAAVSLAPRAAAQSLDDQIRDLRIMMQGMQERLEALEAENARLKSEAAKDAAVKDQAVNERIEALETKVEEAEPAPNDINVYWRDSLRFDSADGNFKLKLIGRIHADTVFASADDDLESVFGDATSGSQFRRARLGIEGTIYGDYGFKAEYDFAGQDADFKDVWVSYNKVPALGQLKAGHFKEPFSLEELTSSNYIDFMERSLANVFAPARNFGVQVSNTFRNDRIYYGAGIFRDAGDSGDSSNADDWAFTGRVAGTPYNRDKNHLLHLGGAASYRQIDSDASSVRIRQRPEFGINADRYVDTRIGGTDQLIGVDDALLLGIETAWLHGPFTLQGEYMMAEYNSDLISDSTFSGGYLQGSYFITGEGKVYNPSSASFDKVKPKKNFGLGKSKGPGAWEVLARYSTLDLNDGDVEGGEQDNITIGLNWYLNTNMRVMFNYVHAMAESDAVTIGDDDRAAYDGDYDAFGLRFQIFW